MHVLSPASYDTLEVTVCRQLGHITVTGVRKV